MKFTNCGVRGLKPKEVAYYEVFETGRKGFGIRVYPRGHKVFIHRYQFEGITRRLVLGAYPALSLADAHELHARQRGLLSQKRDPWEAAHVQLRGGTWDLGDFPVAGIKAPFSENRRDSVLSEGEIRAFWGSLEQMSMTGPVKLALRFQLVTAQRKSEVIAANWDQFDLAAAIWTIPTEKAKNKMVHRVPLSPLALELLKEIRACSAWCEYDRRAAYAIG